MALVPQPPVPPSSAPPGGPAPLSGFWLGVAAAALAVASVISGFCKEIAARWRGIVVAHLFFLTLWMAIQVFFFATGAHWCVPSNGSRVVEWLTRSFAQVARCGPAPPAASAAFHGGTAVAAPALAPALAAPPRPSDVIPAAPRAQSPPASSGASAGASFGAASAGIRPPPASAQQATPTQGPLPGWSPKAIANCWRNRAVDSGDCYETADPRRRPPPPQPVQQQPPPRYRYSDGPPPSHYFPCRRGYDCWQNDYWQNDYRRYDDDL